MKAQVPSLAMDEISLRNYRGLDIEAMFRLDIDCFAPEFRFDRESMRAFAEDRGAIALLAETMGGELAGFVIIHVERVAVRRRRGYVVTLDVAEEWRRKGLAGRLMREAEARAIAAGARWMELHVFTGNDAAIRFYERLGYERIALRQRFYGAEGLDAFVYRKEIENL
jgi:[ribosomal protein S18]-alanine N-acetyltransferase